MSNAKWQEPISLTLRLSSRLPRIQIRVQRVLSDMASGESTTGAEMHLLCANTARLVFCDSCYFFWPGPPALTTTRSYLHLDCSFHFSTFSPSTLSLASLSSYHLKSPHCGPGIISLASRDLEPLSAMRTIYLEIHQEMKANTTAQAPTLVVQLAFAILSSSQAFSNSLPLKRRGPFHINIHGRFPSII
ncbi:hypothetical protein BU26DRAFT_49583 [Trematosphaeria pertusa]|uniref:Uncharacterized protein n=1 Tax=Trematosphaeria pertusa TaxID=390896 RepID=A0A6A6I897_9PLEO|nr:uncharacterized protein BU26DRAFT_49583 [Trematosphaeria pertusa]KAF2246576.1 hypothetical protein BU26DRAFT_49583 [Trematosphaeria pertusa]